MKKILFFCTGCNSSYTIARQDAERLPSGIFVCKTCGKNIKIVFCPECKTSYSIGFQKQLVGSYSLKCRHCGREFRVSFEASKLQKTSQFIPGDQRFAEMKRNEIDYDSSMRAPQKETRTKIQKEKLAGQVLAEDFFSLETLRRYFISIFNINKIMTAVAGVLALAVLLVATTWVENLFQRFEFVRRNFFTLHLLNFFEVFCFASVIVSVNATIAHLTNERGEVEYMSVRDVARFGVSRAIPLMAGVFGIILVLNMLIVIFSSIPIIGPVLYSLLFLPVYVLSVAIVLLSVIAFWFYPPLLAFAENMRSSIAEFFDFIRRHHVSLLLIAMILSVITSIFAGLLLILHTTTLSIILSLSRAFLEDAFLKMIPPVSVSVGDSLNLISFFSGISVMHKMMGELFLAQRIGGILLGMVMMILSTIVYSVILSGTGTLSAWAYRAVKSGKYPNAQKLRYFLITLALILAVLYLFKKVFLS